MHEETSSPELVYSNTNPKQKACYKDIVQKFSYITLKKKQQLRFISFEFYVVSYFRHSYPCN